MTSRSSGPSDICPKCRRRTLRTFVLVGFSIPTSMKRRLMKAKIRRQQVEMQAALWEQSRTRCMNPDCSHGWSTWRK